MRMSVQNLVVLGPTVLEIFEQNTLRRLQMFSVFKLSSVAFRLNQIVVGFLFFGFGDLVQGLNIFFTLELAQQMFVTHILAAHLTW